MQCIAVWCIILRKYRKIEWFSSGGNFSRLRTAKNEGYLAGNRDFCRQQAAEIHPLECVSKCQEMQFRADLTAFQGDFPQACRVRAPGKLSSGEFSVRTGRSLLSNGAAPPVERGGRLLVASQGKSTQKCSQRRRNCASGILETHPNGLRALCGISLAPAVWRRLMKGRLHRSAASPRIRGSGLMAGYGGCFDPG